MGARLRSNGAGPFTAGIVTGSLGLTISFALKGLIPGRPLGDPLPVVLSITQFTRGFTYFQWRPPLFHLLFAVFLGALAAIVLRLLNPQHASRDDAVMAARVAAITNVGLVALLAVDAVIVGFWYLLAGLLSILVSGLAAGIVFLRWQGRRAP